MPELSAEVHWQSVRPWLAHLAAGEGVSWGNWVTPNSCHYSLLRSTSFMYSLYRILLGKSFSRTVVDSTLWEIKCSIAQTGASCHGRCTFRSSSLSSVTPLNFSLASLLVCVDFFFDKGLLMPSASMTSLGYAYHNYPLIDLIRVDTGVPWGTTWIPSLHCGTADLPPTFDLVRLGLTEYQLFMAFFFWAPETSNDTMISHLLWSLTL